MNFNLINNLETCALIIRDYIPVSVVYYTHIPAAIVSLLLGFFIYFKNKTITSKIILFLAIIFSVWSFFDIILWTSHNSQSYVFFWSLTPILEILLFILSIYITAIFFKERDLSFKNKFYLFLTLIPIILLVPTIYNIGFFNTIECVPVDNVLYPKYALPLRGVLLMGLLIVFIQSYRNIINEKRKQLLIIFIGLFLFLISFFFSNIVGNYFIENGILSYVDGYKIEMYSLFAFPIFLGLLTFIIVRFQAFNIKLLGAQALVYALIILVGAQFLYKQHMPLSSLVLAGVTFLLSILIGVLVIKSVKKLDAQRELLDVANKNQQSLLHFITHQVKGYLTKSRNIFDGLIQKDYGELPAEALNMAQHGFDSDTRGVETVQAILRASDLKSGRIEFKKESTNLSALVAEVIESRKESADAKGLELTFEIEPNIMLEVDPIQLKEVFKNLITNSIFYTQKGTVHVVLKRENGKVKFSVVDTGVGLSPEDKSKLFTEGGKGEEALNHNIDSTGYGLFIAKNIVHKHHGQIGAISEGRGKGSEFFVIL